MATLTAKTSFFAGRDVHHALARRPAGSRRSTSRRRPSRRGASSRRPSAARRSTCRSGRAASSARSSRLPPTVGQLSVGRAERSAAEKFGAFSMSAALVGDGAERRHGHRLRRVRRGCVVPDDPADEHPDGHEAEHENDQRLPRLLRSFRGSVSPSAKNIPPAGSAKPTPTTGYALQVSFRYLVHDRRVNRL